ncbi:MAG: hypothetical protein JWP01_3863 [Myxococcales bacterium]|nr:hypothetical protein [Myxococcales bacterium]
MLPAMRLFAVALVLCAACGDGDKTPKDAASYPTIDAPTLAACATPVNGTTLRLTPAGTVDDAAMLVVSPAGDLRRFVVEQTGRIRVFEDEQLLPVPFLDLSDLVSVGSESGLLGLAFHPEYAGNGLFFVFYTTSDANVVARCSVSADRNIAKPSCTPILSIPDFAGNHNGGMMEFGKDGFLYIGTGDGGAGGDPRRNGQNRDALLGKLLRIDVDRRDAGKEYASPPTNPFFAGGGAPEVFIIGVRNPWRWSFDKLTGDLWIGDVGQQKIEELHVLASGQQAGKNLGWSIYEGDQCCATVQGLCEQSAPQQPCDDTGLTLPQDQRTHADGWISIIAGEVYRGTCFPDLVGWHFYTDHTGGQRGLWKARLEANGTLEIVDTGIDPPAGVASIHADARGELYLTTIDRAIYRLEAAP